MFVQSVDGYLRHAALQAMKIGDFGMSRFVGADEIMTALGPQHLSRNLTVDVIGTAHYASPELLNDEVWLHELILQAAICRLAVQASLTSNGCMSSCIATCCLNARPVRLRPCYREVEFQYSLCWQHDVRVLATWAVLLGDMQRPSHLQPSRCCPSCCSCWKTCRRTRGGT